MKIHPVFYSNLLWLDPKNLLPGQIKALLPPVIIKDKEEFKVERILDLRLYGKNKRLQYKVA